MDIPAYISSGILESYVLGITSPEETREVETFAAQYPAIRIELNKIEDSLNDYASLHGQTPPASVRDKIFAAVEAKYVAQPTVKVESKIVSIKQHSESRNSSTGLKWFAAAACIALLMSIGFNYKLYKDAELTKTNSELMAEDISNLNSKLNKQLTETERISKNFAMVSKPGTKIIEMKGLDKSPQSSALIYWNQNSSEVMLHIESLPAPPGNMQYQLWAIVAGQPVSIGMLDLQTDQVDIQLMKAVQNPEAFAVTLEKMGGSPTPTMDQMFVMGKNG